MRRKNTQSLSDVLQDFVNALGLAPKLKEQEIISLWPELMGRNIASRTSKVAFRDGTLYVSLSSSVARNELQMMREGIKDAMNRRLGAAIVKEVVIR